VSPRAESIVSPVAGTVPSAADRAGRLFSWLQTQPLEGYERSFKLCAGRLLANRFLMGIPVERIAPPGLFEICHELAMPDRFIERVKAELPGANTVHFGFEEGNGGGIFKLYLEYWNRLNPARERGDDSVLLHRAYKWDALDGERSMVANYRCFLRLSREQTLSRIAAIYGGETDHPAFGFVDRLVALACTRTDEKLMYLEVSEEQNPRASFDLNFHAAGLKLGEIEPQLMAMCRHHEVPAEQFALLWQGIATRTLGHLSGGSSRDGEDFMTIYYDPLG
jgi:hypothetical protein